jgi:hypothetical protein
MNSFHIKRNDIPDFVQTFIDDDKSLHYSVNVGTAGELIVTAIDWSTEFSNWEPVLIIAPGIWLSVAITDSISIPPSS